MTIAEFNFFLKLNKVSEDYLLFLGQGLQPIIGEINEDDIFIDHNQKRVEIQ